MGLLQEQIESEKVSQIHHHHHVKKQSVVGIRVGMRICVGRGREWKGWGGGAVEDGDQVGYQVSDGCYQTFRAESLRLLLSGRRE